MKNKKIILPIIIVITILIGLISQQNKKLDSQLESQTTNFVENQIATNCFPTFLDGGGPYYEPNIPFREIIAPENNTGIELTVKGKVLASDCTTPLSGAVVDIWQANESGNYEDEWYRGRVIAQADGTYQFTTVIPKGYGEGTAFRPPHIHFKIWRNNELLITSQMFLPESREQGIEEKYIMKVINNGNGTFLGLHNIVLP